MKLKIFCVFDSKVNAFLQPFFFPATGSAIRAWETTVNDPQTQFNKYPGDFTLFETGSYDEETGEFSALPAKLNLGTALQFIKPSDADRQLAMFPAPTPIQQGVK